MTTLFSAAKLPTTGLAVADLAMIDSLQHHLLVVQEFGDGHGLSTTTDIMVMWMT